jgi:hypothetical protein
MPGLRAGLIRSGYGVDSVGVVIRPIHPWLVLAAAFLSLPALAVAGQAVRTIDTRPGVAMRMAVLLPEMPAKAVLIMFPGGNGVDHFRERDDGTIRLGGNFLVRTAPQFVQRGFTVAIVDAPSDQRGGMSDAFRTSAQHAADIERAIDALSTDGPQPTYLIGTSRGTLSVASLATRLTDERVKGIVLTSSLGGTRGLRSLPLGRITVPVLVVHHRDDACPASLFRDAAQMVSLIAHSPRLNLVEVSGGLASAADPCEPYSAHGFIGIEHQVVEVIAEWISGHTVPARIGP